MLKIFYGRESIDKERFIYKEIGESGKRTLVIVPDQYTLEAEKRAFDVLGAEALMDIEIISLSRLGFKVLTEDVRPLSINTEGICCFPALPLNTTISSRFFGEACEKLRLSKWPTISSLR